MSSTSMSFLKQIAQQMRFVWESLRHSTQTLSTTFTGERYAQRAALVRIPVRRR